MASVAIELIREFSKTQAELCHQLAAEYALSNDDDLITLVPKSGLLSVGGQHWSFAKHGLGVLFSSQSDARVIDAHSGPISLPHAFDAWRLMQFFEALDVQKVEAGSSAFSVGSRIEVENLLAALADEGSLSGVAAQPSMYVLA